MHNNYVNIRKKIQYYLEVGQLWNYIIPSNIMEQKNDQCVTAKCRLEERSSRTPDCRTMDYRF